MAACDDAHIVIFTVNDVYLLDHLPSFATRIQKAKKEAGVDAVLATLNGDFLGPSGLSQLDKGALMVKALNACGITHVCFGNHEFDLPACTIDKRISEFRGVWLNSNIAGFEASTKEYDILNVKGFKIGMFAVCTEDTVNMNGLPTAPGARIRFSSHSAKAVEWTKILREEHHVDYVVALTHCYVNEDRELARLVPNVGLMLGGHDHAPFMCQVNGVSIVKTGQDAEYGARIDIRRQGGKVDVEMTLFEAKSEKDDPAVMEIVEAGRALVKRAEGWTVYTIPGEGSLSSKGIRDQQTSIGKLFGTVAAELTRSNCALLNAGQIRAKKDYAGHLSLADVQNECPLPDLFLPVYLPGHVIQETLKFALARAHKEWGGYIQYAGLTVDESFNIVSINDGVWRRLLKDMTFADFDDDHDGSIEPAEFRKHVEARYPGVYKQDQIDRIFKSIDMSGDGLVAVDEFERALSEVESPFDPNATYRVVMNPRMLDGLDNCAPLAEYGKLYTEWKTRMADDGRRLVDIVISGLYQRKWRQLLAALPLKTLDIKGNGVIEAATLRSAIDCLKKLEDEELAHMMNVLDVNGDGTITITDIIQALN